MHPCAKNTDTAVVLPRRILRYMQDPELHGLVYGRQRQPLSPLI